MAKNTTKSNKHISTDTNPHPKSVAAEGEKVRRRDLEIGGDVKIEIGCGVGETRGVITGEFGGEIGGEIGGYIGHQWRR